MTSSVFICCGTDASCLRYIMKVLVFLVSSLFKIAILCWNFELIRLDVNLHSNSMVYSVLNTKVIGVYILLQFLRF